MIPERIPTLDELSAQAAKNLTTILVDLCQRVYGPDLNDGTAELIDLAESAIQLRVFPLVALATVLETNAAYAQLVHAFVAEVAAEAVGYLDRNDDDGLVAEIPGQLTIDDQLDPVEPF